MDPRGPTKNPRVLLGDRKVKFLIAVFLPVYCFSIFSQWNLPPSLLLLFACKGLLLLFPILFVVTLARKGYLNTFLGLGIILLITGSSLNVLVMALNNGCMPVMSPYIGGWYTSMEGARLTVLSDHIFGLASIGDIVLFLSVPFLIRGADTSFKKWKRS